jgi:uncharacterized membrane protein YeaQ/YmgE (transglycosylase-associated protein family)
MAKGGEIKIMSLLVYLVFGALAGWLASIIMGTDAQQGAVMNIVVGIVGAFVGGLLMNAFGQSGVTGFNLYSVIVAVLGSVVFLWLYRMLRYR